MSESNIEDEIAKGTTTIGLLCKDAVILATERRATMGNIIASPEAKKIYPIDRYIGATTAGSVGDAQMMMRLLTRLAALHQHTHEEKHMTVQHCANQAADILTQEFRARNPLHMVLIVGGVDMTGGGRIYSTDPAGGIIEDSKFISTGSGSSFVYGVLEDRYKKDMSIEEGVDLAIRSISVAMKRDSASGGTIQVVTITKENGFVQIDPEYIMDKIEQFELARK